MAAVGVPATVRVWHDAEGWGVLDSPATPGGCWTHYSALDMDGRATAEPGDAAVLQAEAAEQDGFSWRAVHVVLNSVPTRAATSSPITQPNSAYSSRLDITFD